MATCNGCAARSFAPPSVADVAEWASAGVLAYATGPRALRAQDTPCRCARDGGARGHANYERLRGVTRWFLACNGERVPMKFTKFGPKGHLSPTLGAACLLCGAPLMLGDFTTLVHRGVADRSASDGAEVHWACAERRGRPSALVDHPR